MRTNTPSRRHRACLVFADGQADPLHHELEVSLLLGRGTQRIPVELQHVDGWRRAWAEHRGTIEPKAAEHLPGIRPHARYVLGELPPPPVICEPPAGHRWFRQWIDGTDRFWTRYPEPWQRNETAWLVEIGEVDGQELLRYRRRIRRPVNRRISPVWRALGDYPLEVGRYA